LLTKLRATGVSLPKSKSFFKLNLSMVALVERINSSFLKCVEKNFSCSMM
jgi:hypothetical protein